LPADFLVEGNFQSDHYIDGLIRANLGKVPIYSVDSSPKIEGYTWVTIGLLKMLVKIPEAANADFIKGSNNLALKSFAINIDEINLSYGNFIPQSIKRFYGFSFNEIGDQMLALKSFSDARNYYKIALAIQPDDPRAFFGIGRTSLELGDCLNAKPFLLKAHNLDGQNTRVISVLADEARRCEQNEGLAKQYEEEANKILRSHMDKL
jgi:tetratricopeptide (TPR) repeat protein